jgi:hypothetical protein
MKKKKWKKGTIINGQMKFIRVRGIDGVDQGY